VQIERALRRGDVADGDAAVERGRRTLGLEQASHDERVPAPEDVQLHARSDAKVALARKRRGEDQRVGAEECEIRSELVFLRAGLDARVFVVTKVEIAQRSTASRRIGVGGLSS
jgi:hypothetical protein